MFVTVIKEPQTRRDLITLTTVGTTASPPFNDSAWTAR